AKGRTAAIVLLRSTPSRAGAQRAWAQGAHQVLAAADGGHVVVRHRFRTMAALAVDLDAEGLARLRDLPAVAHVGRDAVVSAEATAAQELARMPAVQERGMVGRGVTVA